jgi:hypothetical protein
MCSGIVLTFMQNPLDVVCGCMHVSVCLMCECLFVSLPFTLLRTHTHATPPPQWRTRLQTTYTTAHQESVLASLLKNKSLFMRGFQLAALRNMPGNGVFFTSYEAFSTLLPDLGVSSISAQKLLSGGLAGLTFNLMFLPSECVRTRMMITTEGDTCNPNILITLLALVSRITRITL